MSFPRTVTFREPNAIGNCCPNLERHRSNNDMPDLVISTKGNSKVCAHRLILGSRFDKVTTRLSGPITRRNTDVNWLAFEHEIIETLVRFAYTGEIEVTLDTAYQLFLCAWNVGSEFVSTCISQFVVERLNLDNINLIWAMADITHSDITRRGCVAFISANLEQMMSTNLLNRQDVRTLSNVLTHENKAVSSEEVVIRSITNWTKYVEHSRTELCRIDHFSELCNLVDWTKVSPCFIANLLVNDQYLASHQKVREELLKAIIANVKPIQTSKTLYAIGEAESGDLFSVVKFDSDKPAESALLGHVEASGRSRTVLLKGLLFVIGGGWDWGAPKRVSTFNVTTGEEGRVADLEIGRVMGHSVAASSDEIFVCGGSPGKKACEAFHPGRSGLGLGGGGGGDFPNRVSTFNVTTGEKGRVADLEVCKTSGHSVAASSDEIFVCGGSPAKKACKAFHSGRSGSWRRLPNLRTGRNFLAVVFLPDGRLLATGGYCGDVLSSCELLNTASQSEGWRLVAEMLQPRSYHGAVYFESRVFVAGGEGYLTSCEVFTPPPLGSTTEIGQWTRIHSEMTREFYSIRSIVVISTDEMLVFGDIGETGEIERFKKVGDFGAWSWTPLPRIGHLRGGEAIGVHPAN